MTIKEILRRLFLGEPILWSVLCAALVALVFFIVLLAVAAWRGRRVRRLRAAGWQGQWSVLSATRPPRAALDWIGVAMLAVPPLAMVIATAWGRAMMIRAAQGATPEVRQELLARGISVQLHAVTIGLAVCFVVWLLGAVALGLAFGHRARLRGLARAGASTTADPAAARAWLAHPGLHPWLLVTMNLVVLLAAAAPFVHGMRRHNLGQITALGAVGGAEPTARATLFEQGLSEARPGQSLSLAAAGLALAFVVSSLILLVADPARRRRALAPQLREERSWAKTISVVTIELVVAGALLVAARGHRKENSTPLPPVSDPASGWSRGIGSGVDVPRLRGPDAVQLGVALTASRRGPDMVEEEPVASEKAAAELLLQHARRLKKIEHLTSGKMRFTGQCLLRADRTLPVSRIEPLLRAALDAGFTRVMLLFVQRSTTVRPILGRIETETATATQLLLAQTGGDGALRSGQFASYQDLASEAVVRRARGQQVVLVLPRPL